MRKELKILLSVIFTILVLSITFFYIIFHNQILSDDIEKWDNFGSFWSFIISLLTLITTISIAIYLESNQEKRLTELRNFEKSKLLAELRSDGYRELMQKVTFRKNFFDLDNLAEISLFITHFSRVNTHLFSENVTDKIFQLGALYLEIIDGLDNKTFNLADKTLRNSIVEKLTYKTKEVQTLMQNYITSNL